MEIGAVTALAQPGNPKPRLYRLPTDEALINRLGFNNDGAVAIAERLRVLRSKRRSLEIPLGINIGRSKIVEPKTPCWTLFRPSSGSILMAIFSH